MTDRPVLTFRVAWWVAASQVVFLVVPLVALGRWAAAGSGLRWWPVSVFALVGVAITGRELRTAVFAYPDRLVVRNARGTERISRSVIEGFGIGRSTTRPLGRGVLVQTRHGRTVMADALTSVSRGPLGLGRARRAAERLQEWLAGPVG